MSDLSNTVALHEVAHSRAGDKGNRANISLIAYVPEVFDHLCRQISVQRVKEHFAHRGVTEVFRYELPRLGALNFVIDDVLEGGVNGSLNLDGHGKTLSFHLLSMRIEIPRALSDKSKQARSSG